MALFNGDPASYSDASLSKGMTGTCLCGAITIRIFQEGLFDSPNGHICHCENCRKSSGAAYINNLILKTENVKLEDPKGYVKVYHDSNTGSGSTVSRSFCSNCSSTLGILPSDRDERLSVVALGLFPRIPEPEFEGFVKHRQAWLGPVTKDCVQVELMEGVEKVIEKVLK